MTQSLEPRFQGNVMWALGQETLQEPVPTSKS